MIVELIEIDGELVLPLPDDIIKQLDWVEGDTLIWSVDELGRVTVKKK